MSARKSSHSKATSYEEIGAFWDRHDLSEMWEQTEPVDFEVDVQAERRFFALDRDLSDRVAKAARRRGVSAETLLNLWVQEKLGDPGASHSGDD